MVNCACCWGQHIFSSMANEQAKFQMFFAQRLKKSQGLSFENSNNIVPDCFCNYSILQKLKKLYLHLLDLGKTFSVFSLCFGPYREYMYALTCQSKHWTPHQYKHFWELHTVQRERRIICIFDSDFTKVYLRGVWWLGSLISCPKCSWQKLRCWVDDLISDH